MKAEQDKAIALVVDLDYTLLCSDSLWESAIRTIADHPKKLLKIPGWLNQGRAVLKCNLAASVIPQVNNWPYNQAVIDQIRVAKEAGRTTCLATAADQSIADAVATHLGLFDLVIGSQDGVNLKGEQKLEKLIREFGEDGFDYIGDSNADLPIWEKSHHAFLVGSDHSSLAKTLAIIKPDFTVLPEKRLCIQTLTQTLRVHQWVKNLLLFVPFVLSHNYSTASILSATVGFFAFCFCASAIYIINDLLDLPADRKHERKKNRPFASGAMPIHFAPLLFLGSFLAGSTAAVFLSFSFALIIGVYFLLTFFYSFRLKRLIILDVIILAGFYVLRIIAGTKALDVPLSNWLLGFACFIFLGLGILKRATELLALKTKNTIHLPGRSYQTNDISILENMAVVSGFCSIVILAMYIESIRASEQYATPFLLWGLCPLITYWYGRLLILAHRGYIHNDPVDFTTTDKCSWYCSGVGLLLLFLSI